MHGILVSFFLSQKVDLILLSTFLAFLSLIDTFIHSSLLDIVYLHHFIIHFPMFAAHNHSTPPISTPLIASHLIPQKAPHQPHNVSPSQTVHPSYKPTCDALPLPSQFPAPSPQSPSHSSPHQPQIPNT